MNWEDYEDVDFANEFWMDMSLLPPVVPHQIGPTCSYHAITTAVESRFRAALREERSRRGILVGFPEEQPPLCVQYLYDFQPERDKNKTMHYTENVGILAVNDYAVGGARGEHLWLPTAILRGSHYRVDRWHRLDPDSIGVVQQAMGYSALYADYCAYEPTTFHQSTPFPIEGRRFRTEEEYNVLKLASHSISIVGHGSLKSTKRPYYIYRNTYGSDFGQQGFGRIFADAVSTIFAPELKEYKRIPYRRDPRTELAFSRPSSSLAGGNYYYQGPFGLSALPPY